MFKNLQQMISNGKGGNPLNMMMNAMLQQNPQLQQMMNGLNGITPDAAKKKIQEMSSQGQISQSQMNQFYTFAEKMGLSKDTIKDEFKDIKIESEKANRW